MARYQLFTVVPQGPGGIDLQHTRRQPIEKIGGMKVNLVDGRILSHVKDVASAEGEINGTFGFEQLLATDEFYGLYPGPRFTIFEAQICQRAEKNAVAAMEAFSHESQRGIRGRVKAIGRVDDEDRCQGGHGLFSN
jgi:hypothetical protein